MARGSDLNAQLTLSVGEVNMWTASERIQYVRLKQQVKLSVTTKPRAPHHGYELATWKKLRELTEAFKYLQTVSF